MVFLRKFSQVSDKIALCFLFLYFPCSLILLFKFGRLSFWGVLMSQYYRQVVVFFLVIGSFHLKICFHRHQFVGAFKSKRLRLSKPKCQWWVPICWVMAIHTSQPLPEEVKEQERDVKSALHWQPSFTIFNMMIKFRQGTLYSCLYYGLNDCEMRS